MIITEIRDGHVHEHVGRELTDGELARIAKQVAKTEGVRLEPVVDVFRVLHLWAKELYETRPVTKAIAAFADETDARIAYHGLRPKLALTCVMCPAGGPLVNDLCADCCGRLTRHEVTS